MATTVRKLFFLYYLTFGFLFFIIGGIISLGLDWNGHSGNYSAMEVFSIVLSIYLLAICILIFLNRKNSKNDIASAILAFVLLIIPANIINNTFDLYLTHPSKVYINGKWVCKGLCKILHSE
jgi:hypothetical protein